MNATPITTEESFLLQSHALVECLINLGMMEATKDQDFEKLKGEIYGQTSKIVNQSGVLIFQGQGVLVSVLYMFLVMPLEWQKNEIGNFAELDLSEPQNIANTKAEVKPEDDTYKKKDQALFHLRNAVAHGHFGWSSAGKLVVKDIKRDGKTKEIICKYAAEYSMESLGELVQSLNMAIAHYIVNEIKPRTST